MNVITLLQNYGEKIRSFMGIARGIWGIIRQVLKALLKAEREQGPTEFVNPISSFFIVYQVKSQPNFEFLSVLVFKIFFPIDVKKCCFINNVSYLNNLIFLPPFAVLWQKGNFISASQISRFFTIF